MSIRQGQTIIASTGMVGGSSSYKGEYSDTTVYNKGDCVSWTDASTSFYMCTQDNTIGLNPPTYHLNWDRISNNNMVDFVERNDDADYFLGLIEGFVDGNAYAGRMHFSDNAPKVNASTGEIIGYAKTEDLPTKVSELENDLGYNTTIYEAGDNIIFENIGGKYKANTDKYYGGYAGDLFDNGNGDLVLLKGLGARKYLRTTLNFGGSYNINDFIRIGGSLNAIKIKFKLVNLPNVDGTFASFLGGAFNTFPKTNIRIEYSATDDTITFIQEYYSESNASCIVNNTYTIPNASTSLLNNWATFSLYKEDSVWKIDVDGLGTLIPGVENNQRLGISQWSYFFICNAYSTNNNQSTENGEFVYDIDLLETGIYDSNGLVLGFCEQEASNTYKIIAETVDAYTKDEVDNMLGDVSAILDAINGEEI